MQLCGVADTCFVHQLSFMIDEQQLLLIAITQINGRVRKQLDQLTHDTFCVVTASAQDLIGDRQDTCSCTSVESYHRTL
jgi:hypothetical protein